MTIDLEGIGKRHAAATGMAERCARAPGGGFKFESVLAEAHADRAELLNELRDLRSERDAIRAQTIEECARICEENIDGSGDEGDSASKSNAGHIRALRVIR